MEIYGTTGSRPNLPPFNAATFEAITNPETRAAIFYWVERNHELRFYINPSENPPAPEDLVSQGLDLKHLARVYESMTSPIVVLAKARKSLVETVPEMSKLRGYQGLNIQSPIKNKLKKTIDINYDLGDAIWFTPVEQLLNCDTNISAMEIIEKNHELLLYNEKYDLNHNTPYTVAVIESATMGFRAKDGKASDTTNCVVYDQDPFTDSRDLEGSRLHDHHETLSEYFTLAQLQILNNQPLEQGRVWLLGSEIPGQSRALQARFIEDKGMILVSVAGTSESRRDFITRRRCGGYAVA